MKSPMHYVRRARLDRQKRGEACSVILMYHRIAPVDVDPWQLQVTPEHFRQHLDVLRRLTTPVPLRRLVADYRTGTLGARSVALTFDDGYADNLNAARPALAAADIPATVYVTTGPTGTTNEFWWDSLDRALLVPPVLPSRLDLPLGGSRRRWWLGPARKGGWSDGAITLWRKRFHYGVWSQLRTLPAAERDAAIAYLHQWAGTETPPRPARRVMTADELLKLEEGGLIEIGAHTVTHPLLPSLAPDAQREEMARSRTDLERLLTHEVKSFSYPYGGADDTTKAIARSLGFESATCVHEETVWRESDVHGLPRFSVRDWDGGEFERRLTLFFNQHVAPQS